MNDHDWFNSNPHRRYRLRRAETPLDSQHELDTLIPSHGQTLMVLVYRDSASSKTRYFLYTEGNLPDDEASLALLHLDYEKTHPSAMRRHLH